jgi:hypothetical protein
LSEDGAADRDETRCSARAPRFVSVALRASSLNDPDQSLDDPESGYCTQAALALPQPVSVSQPGPTDCVVVAPLNVRTE